MPGLVPGIHVLPHKIQGVDGRDNPRHDGAEMKKPTDEAGFSFSVWARRPYEPCMFAGSSS
jgi:hypothetical protein